MSTTFKTPAPAPEPAPEFEEAEKSTMSSPDGGMEVPFTEYQNINKIPFTAEYIDAKLTWDEAYMVEDVETIEDYLKDIVGKGDLANTTKAAKDKLQKLEKMANIDKLESKAQRLIKLAEFIRYLNKVEERKYDWS